MPDEPIANVGGLDVFLAADDPGTGSITMMLFTGQADGAIPNGTRVEKVNSEPGDSFPDGTEGTVLASALVVELGAFGYYVAFDPRPVACFIAGYRIKPVGKTPST